MAEARRTLVKSPPELWAEISDPDSLSKHLEAFGEIRITRVEPETTVAWEGDRACGTVELEASGWGTKVRLTAEPVEVEVEESALQQPLAAEEEAPAPPEPAEPAAEAAPAAPAAPEAAPDDSPEPAEPAAEAAPAAPADPPPAPPPAAATAGEAASDGEAPPPRHGFFARLFRRRHAQEAASAPEPVAEEPRAAGPQPEAARAAAAAPPEPEPEPAAEAAPPEPEPEPAAEATPPEPEPEPAAEATPPEREPAAPVEVPSPADEIRVSRLGDDEAAQVLDAVLDTLGAAHHRPFSR